MLAYVALALWAAAILAAGAAAGAWALARQLRRAGSEVDT